MSQQKNVLYLSYDGLTDPLGQSQVLPYLKGLQAKGYNLHIVSFEKPEAFAQLRDTIESLCEEAQLQWYPQPYTKKPPILSTMKDLRMMKQVSASLHRIHGFEIVHARSYISGMAALWMKKKFGIRFLFDMRGFWADERVDGGLWPQKNLLYKIVYRYFKKQEKLLLNGADHIVSLTHSAKEEINRWPAYQNQPLPISVIPCCVDTQHFNPENNTAADQTGWLTTLGWNAQHKVLVYLGSLGTWYLLEEMLAFCKQVMETDPQVRTLFITRDEHELVRARAEAMGIPREKLHLRSAQRRELPGLLGLAFAGLFFIKPVYSKKASSPVKQGELMAMGIPVFCNGGIGDTDYIINTFKSGILLPQLNDAAFKKAWEQFEQTQFSARELRDGARQYFGLEAGISAYSEIYKSLINLPESETGNKRNFKTHNRID